MTHSAEITEIAAALALAQGAFDTLKTDAKADIKSDRGANFTYKYATLAKVLDVVRKTLSVNGISILQSPELHENRLVVETRLVHKSGQWFCSVLSLPVPQMTAQGIGGVITYARRYSLCSLVGIAPDDDDDAQSATDAANSTPQGRTNGREGVYGTPAERRDESETYKPQNETQVASVGQCPECHAPDGKPHTKSCKAVPNLALISTEESPIVETNHNLDAFGSGIPAGVA